MFIVVWKYKVKPDCLEAFERLYGNEGEWVLLFKRFAGYHGTELLKRSNDPDSYLTIDRWESAEVYQKFLTGAKEDYQRIDKKCEPLMLEEIKIGSFEEI